MRNVSLGSFANGGANLLSIRHPDNRTLTNYSYIVARLARTVYAYLLKMFSRTPESSHRFRNFKSVGAKQNRATGVSLSEGNVAILLPLFVRYFGSPTSGGFLRFSSIAAHSYPSALLTSRRASIPYKFEESGGAGAKCRYRSAIHSRHLHMYNMDSDRCESDKTYPVAPSVHF